MIEPSNISPGLVDSYSLLIVGYHVQREISLYWEPQNHGQQATTFSLCSPATAAPTEIKPVMESKTLITAVVLRSSFTKNIDHKIYNRYHESMNQSFTTLNPLISYLCYINMFLPLRDMPGLPRLGTANCCQLDGVQPTPSSNLVSRALTGQIHRKPMETNPETLQNQWKAQDFFKCRSSCLLLFLHFEDSATFPDVLDSQRLSAWPGYNVVPLQLEVVKKSHLLTKQPITSAWKEPHQVQSYLRPIFRLVTACI